MSDSPRRPGPRHGDGFATFLGLEWDDASTVRLAIRPDLVNVAGLLLGPAVFALVDYAMASVLYEQTAPDEFMATTSVSINFVGSAQHGQVVCRTRLDHRNRRTGILSSEVRHEDARLLATAIGSFSIFPAAVLDRRRA